MKSQFEFVNGTADCKWI